LLKVYISEVDMKLGFATAFPDLIQDWFSQALLKRAIERSLVSIDVLNLRDYSDDPHRRIDDTPFGGGPGMLLKCEPIVKALEDFEAKNGRSKRVLLSARGKSFEQVQCHEWVRDKQPIFFICGRYEGVDHRVIEYFVDYEVRVGEFIMMGGEAPALCLSEAIIRCIPGVLGNQDSLVQESFSDDYLQEYPQYTRPANFRGYEVPELLRSGNHQAIEAWRSSNGR